jgi:hypothetical protein
MLWFDKDNNLDEENKKIVMDNIELSYYVNEIVDDDYEFPEIFSEDDDIEYASELLRYSTETSDETRNLFNSLKNLEYEFSNLKSYVQYEYVYDSGMLEDFIKLKNEIIQKLEKLSLNVYSHVKRKLEDENIQQ